MERIAAQRAQKQNISFQLVGYEVYTYFPFTKSGVKFYVKTCFLPKAIKSENIEFSWNFNLTE